MEGCVVMSRKELDRVSVMSRVTNGDMRGKAASDMWGISYRQCPRISVEFKASRASCLAHGLRGPPGYRNGSIDIDTLEGQCSIRRSKQ